ncbi:hypothetical protein ACFSC4_27850 [Deinococcus malanensis]|uniref:hypothetical protein n=1 Tax=Deinococcus malanensis TaxID=1706855 RepID=UPI0036459408
MCEVADLLPYGRIVAVQDVRGTRQEEKAPGHTAGRLAGLQMVSLFVQSRKLESLFLRESKNLSLLFLKGDGLGWRLLYIHWSPHSNVIHGPHGGVIPTGLIDCEVPSDETSFS